MSTAVLEQLRSSREELETIEKAVSKCLCMKKGNAKHSVMYERCAAYLMKLAQDKAKTIVALYNDQDGMRRDEMLFLAGQKLPGQVKASDVWMNFYDKMKSIKDHHKKTYLTSTVGVEFRDVDYFVSMALNVEQNETRFSGEEAIGKRVDLHENFNEFINLKKLASIRRTNHTNATFARWKKKDSSIEPTDLRVLEDVENFQEMDYITWLQEFDQLHLLPRHSKYRDSAYLQYLTKLDSKLHSFIERALPLLNLNNVKTQFEKEFEENWQERKINGWAVPSHKETLFCRPSNRLFANENAMKGHMGSKPYHKNLKRMQDMSLTDQQKAVDQMEDEDKTLARLESRIGKFHDILGDHVDETVAHLQKKQSRTVEEMMQEEESSEEEEEVVEEPAAEESDDGQEVDRPIYNPLNLPLGWDGKPIPFWLYKLHGLGKEYKCQICGNYSYWGRRAYERHFQEWRHAFGMKCLKIPNTSHFKEITKIDEAVELYEKLKRTAEGQTFRPDVDIECEDAHGNVMSLRAYEDLQRQGLV